MAKITNKNSISKIERLIVWTLNMTGYFLQYPVLIDIGDEGMSPNFAGGIVYDDEANKWLLMFNATTPWWLDGKEPLAIKVMRTVRHEVRHLYQREYIKSHYGFDDLVINILMGDDLWGSYENNPYEWDAHRFEDSDQVFEEGLEWIDQVIAH